MSSIVLKKNGFHVKEYNEKSNLSSYSKVKGHLGHYLQNILEIEKGVTVEDLMKELIRHEVDVDTMFFGFSKGFNMRPFYEEMLMKPDNKRKDLSYVEFSWMADYYRNDSIGNEVMIFMQMNGMTTSKKENETLSYNLSQIPLNDWKHLEIRVSNLLLVYDFQVNKKDENGTFGTRVITLLEAKKEVTLYDFIGGFIDCITWHGYPENRNERVNDINTIVHQEEDVIIYDIEDKEYELKKAIEREDYELASVLKKQIDSLKKK